MLPPVVKNLLIINGLGFLAYISLQNTMNIDLNGLLGMHYFTSSLFKPYQLITYMFMHGDFGHLFFNMFAFWMFGCVLENVWGPKRFLLFYFVTGIGAILTQMLVNYIQISYLVPHMSAHALDIVYNSGIVNEGDFEYKNILTLYGLINGSTVGASGAVFGILLAFGMMFPNSLIYVYFAIPVKAKWFVIIYGAIELGMGFYNRAGDNVAHFAHLGGMLFGLILILYWRRQQKKRIENGFQ
jgi:membrane associated rhomboid family serine protease